MTDLAERLRAEKISAPPEHPVHPSICDEAADEIDRLWDVVDAARLTVNDRNSNILWADLRQTLFRLAEETLG